MRQLELNQNDIVTKCPKCGNNTKFKADSSQIGEDCCETWVECVCGYDPTAGRSELRYETTWGGTGHSSVMIALDCWNDAINGEMPDSKSPTPH